MLRPGGIFIDSIQKRGAILVRSEKKLIQIFLTKIFSLNYYLFWSKNFWAKHIFEVQICFALKPSPYQTGV